jgi:hypothetical protein
MKVNTNLKPVSGAFYYGTTRQPIHAWQVEALPTPSGATGRDLVAMVAEVEKLMTKWCGGFPLEADYVMLTETSLTLRGSGFDVKYEVEGRGCADAVEVTE